MNRQRLKRFFCVHTYGYANGQPLHPIRSCRATEENRRAFWGAILDEFTCHDCGDHRLMLMTGWQGRRL